MTETPSRFTSEAGAKANFEAFTRRVHEILDDELMDYANEFVTRSHPELVERINAMMNAGDDTATTDIVESTPEYDLFYAEVSGVIQAVLLRLMNDFSPNITGRQAYEEAQRRRNMVGAPS